MKLVSRFGLGALSAFALAACQPATPVADVEENTAVDSNSYLASGAQVEDLGGAFGWAEGPVWIDAGYLLFTDVPGNTIWRYQDEDGLSVWMQPSGADPVPDYTSSPGANGLLAYGSDAILLPDHGNRVLSKIDLATQDREVLADRFDGKRFNSPNDVVVHDSGMIYFTDPPYGLSGQDESAAKELDFNGVFALAQDGTVSLIDDSLTRPNGIALSPDGRTLYVANSDPASATFTSYPVTDDGSVGPGTLMVDMTPDLEREGFGNPDGMAVATDGTIFATGPGGVLVMTPDAQLLGTIRTGKPVANVTFGGADRKTLYMTSYDRLFRVETSKQGLPIYTP